MTFSRLCRRWRSNAERRTPFGVRWRVVTDYVGSRREPRCYVRRCQQIRIWPRRGRARQREMKFDRSAPHTRAPLSSPFLVATLLLPLPLAPFDVSSANERRFLDFTGSLAAKWRFSHLQGAPRASDASSRFRECSPPPPPVPFWLARGAVHPILYNSLLSATSLPPVTLPRGAVQAGLLSSKPTPFYKYITRPSALAIPCLSPFSVSFSFASLFFVGVSYAQSVGDAFARIRA